MESGRVRKGSDAERVQRQLHVYSERTERDASRLGGYGVKVNRDPASSFNAVTKPHNPIVKEGFTKLSYVDLMTNLSLFNEHIWKEVHRSSQGKIATLTPENDVLEARNWLANFLEDARVLKYGGNESDYTKLFGEWCRGIDENPHAVGLIYALYLNHADGQGRLNPDFILSQVVNAMPRPYLQVLANAAKPYNDANFNRFLETAIQNSGDIRENALFGNDWNYADAMKELDEVKASDVMAYQHPESLESADFEKARNDLKDLLSVSHLVGFGEGNYDWILGRLKVACENPAFIGILQEDAIRKPNQGESLLELMPRDFLEIIRDATDVQGGWDTQFKKALEDNIKEVTPPTTPIVSREVSPSVSPEPKVRKTKPGQSPRKAAEETKHIIGPGGRTMSVRNMAKELAIPVGGASGGAAPKKLPAGALPLPGMGAAATMRRGARPSESNVTMKIEDADVKMGSSSGSEADNVPGGSRGASIKDVRIAKGAVLQSGKRPPTRRTRGEK